MSRPRWPSCGAGKALSRPFWRSARKRAAESRSTTRSYTSRRTPASWCSTMRPAGSLHKTSATCAIPAAASLPLNGVMWKTVSEDCNLACDYCYYSTCGGRPGPRRRRIDAHLIEKFIVEYLEQSGPLASFAWKGGEPLLAGLGFFEDVIRLQARHAKPGVQVVNVVQTNGILLDRDWARFFSDHRFLVGVSVDGPQAIHDARRVTASGAGSFDLAMRGIGHLRNCAVEFNVLTVLHEGNVGKAAELMAFYVREGFSHVQLIPGMDFASQQPGTPASYLISPTQYGDFLCQAFDLWHDGGAPALSIRFFDNVLGVYLNRAPELCTQARCCPRTLVMEHNGDAYPCDFYMGPQFRLGNALTDALADIAASPLFSGFLAMKPVLNEKCAKCGFRDACNGGCP